jgi:hypothetical protein
MRLPVISGIFPVLATLFTLFLPVAASAAPLWGVAVAPTPVFNSPDTAEALKGGRFVDRCGLNRALEFIALPGTAFRIEAELHRGGRTVYRVETDDYPYRLQSGLFVDADLLKAAAERPPERPRRLPGREEIVSRLLSAAGRPYVWGGNLRDGIAGSSGALFAGLDCSGLLYEATNGVTPRNTSALVSFGRVVPVAGLGRDAITERVQPLDLIVWQGHVIIVLDHERTIESRLECRTGKFSGVVIRSLRETLDGLLQKRTPANEQREGGSGGGKTFVIRRWFEAGTEQGTGR